MTERTPGPLVRWLLRVPARLYDWNAGWLLGQRFLLLTHVGRRTGRRHQTLLEVIGRRPAAGEFLVIAGLGRSANWYRSVIEPLEEDPDVEVREEWLGPSASDADGSAGPL